MSKPILKPGDKVMLEDLSSIPCPAEYAAMEAYIPAPMREYFGQVVTIKTCGVKTFTIEEMGRSYGFRYDWINKRVAVFNFEADFKQLCDGLRLKVQIAGLTAFDFVGEPGFDPSGWQTCTLTEMNI